MTNIRSFQAVLSLLLPAALLHIATASADTQPVKINDDPRPVAQALEQLERVYLVPLTYEDMRYLHESDLKLNEQGHSVIKGGPVAFAYDAPPSNATADSRKPLAVKAITDLLRTYNTGRGTPTFTMTVSNDGLHVVALQSKDTSGITRMFQPLLDTPISIGPGQRSAAQCLGQIALAISSARQVPVHTGTIPMPLFAQHDTNLTATNEPARSVLARLLAEIPVGYLSAKNATGGRDRIPSVMSWQLFCGPPDSYGECALNIHVVAPENAPTVGMGPPAPPISEK